MRISEVSHTDIIGSSIGLLAIIVAIFLYFRAKTDAVPTYTILKHEFIRPSDCALSQPNSSQAVIVFWNAGRKVLDGNDIDTDDPIRFHFSAKGKEQVSIQKVGTIHSTRRVLNVSAAHTKKTVNLSFKFLDRSDGFWLEVFYTGSEAAKITCTGTIKGVPKGVRKKVTFTLGQQSIGALEFICGLGLLIAGLGLPFVPPPRHIESFKNGLEGMRWDYIIFTYHLTFGVIISSLGAAIIASIIILRRRENIPVTLRKKIKYLMNA